MSLIIRIQKSRRKKNIDAREITVKAEAGRGIEVFSSSGTNEIIFYGISTSKLDCEKIWNDFSLVNFFLLPSCDFLRMF